MLRVVAENYFFKTIQGEGLTIGLPTYFLRLWGCNYTCSWCDTKESWKPGSPYKMLQDDEIDELKRTIGKSNLVVTGGEPFLQMAKVLRHFNALDIGEKCGEYPTYTIESNMSLYSDPIAKQVMDHGFFLSFSPKLHNWPEASVQQWLEYLTSDIQKAYRFQLKIVCEDCEDYSLAELYLRSHYTKMKSNGKTFPWDLFCKNVIIQPEWSICDRSSTTDDLKRLLDHAIERGEFRVIPQTHKMLGIP